MQKTPSGGPHPSEKKKKKVKKIKKDVKIEKELKTEKERNRKKRNQGTHQDREKKLKKEIHRKR